MSHDFSFSIANLPYLQFGFVLLLVGILFCFLPLLKLEPTNTSPSVAFASDLHGSICHGNEDSLVIQQIHALLPATDSVP